MSEVKDLLRTCGAPRNGNSYINQCLNLLYYTDEDVSLNFHNTDEFLSRKMTICPYRNPLDACSSDYLELPDLQISGQVVLSGTSSKDFSDTAINEYIVFYQIVLENEDKICLLDFDRFTTDIQYVKDRIYKYFNLKSNILVTDKNIKDELIKNLKFKNLPRDNKEENEKAKKEILNNKNFKKATEIYDKLKKSEAKSEGII